MQSLTFLGASEGIVTGSNYLLTDSSGYGIVVDMGMFQGSEETNQLNYREIGFDAREVHTVLLTHAHLDHCGRLPMLVRNGFTGKAYMTPATRALVEVVLYDSAKINKKDKHAPLLYTEEDVEEFMRLVEVVDYEEDLKISNIKVRFRDAGHILGSASIMLDNGENKLIFSGDLGNTPEEIVSPTKYFDAADLVVMESTYGDKTHPTEDVDSVLKSEINAVEESGGTLLIPSFSIERTQVILHRIDHLKKDGNIKNETSVYLDSPMGIKATEIYKSFKDLYNQTLEEHSRMEDPFDFPGLKIIERAKDSKKIAKSAGTKVIIAGSGMMSGGRILNHAIDFLPLETTRLLIVGYQAEGTTGRHIIDGDKKLRIYGQNVTMNAKLTELHSMSAHADQPRLMKWIKNISGVKKVYLTHGENPQREILSKKIKAETQVSEVLLPNLLDTFPI